MTNNNNGDTWGYDGDIMEYEVNLRYPEEKNSWLEHIPNIPRAECERTKLPIQDWPKNGVRVFTPVLFLKKMVS